MVHLAFLLVVGGFAGALVRDYRNSRGGQYPKLPAGTVSDCSAKHVSTEKLVVEEEAENRPAVFDDVGELRHYQKVSWYALAFSASGAWFYPPAVLVSVPLLGYNTYNFVKIIRQSDKPEQTSPMAIFEAIAIGGTLVTGRPVAASVLMLLSFGTRKLLLQAGNITNNVDFSKPVNPRAMRVWALRDGVEVESAVADLQSGDVLVLHSGDTIVVEGRVLEGMAMIRQFGLSKQMKLVPKQVGDKVYPFTYLEKGLLHVTV